MSTTTHTPSNQGELELYRVLHRANLLQYYDTFISQGGDDVQQLCEAGEEEFLEIMALVGMAAKPLHVRRLQKALQEWVANPALFAQMVPSTPSSSSSSATAAATATSTTPKSQSLITITTTPPHQTPSTTTTNASSLSPSAGNSGTISAQTWVPSSNDTKGFAVIAPTSSNGGSIKDELIEKPSSPMPQIALMENQILAIEECARELVKTLPPYSPKPLSLKKQINQDIMNVINLDFDDPSRMEEVRKYSAIYGRFDSKRKNLKPMSLHEICVNEAAAQICRYIPNLLTRRDELFPLARQVVRDSGYQYSKGHSRTGDMIPGTGGTLKKSTTPTLPLMPGQIVKMGPDDLDKAQVRLLAERMAELTQDLAAILQQQEIVKTKMTKAQEETNVSLVHDLQGELEMLQSRQLQVLAEQGQIMKTQKRPDGRFYTVKTGNENGDGTDSLHSGASSPQSSCISEETDYKQTDFYTSPPKKNPTKTKMFVQKSLFDEGLRIAQQYGMADFAEEIVDMKTTKKEDGDEVDCDDEEVDSYTNDFRPVRVKTEGSDTDAERSAHYGDQNGQNLNLNLKRSLDDDESAYNARKYACGVHGLKVEKMKIPIPAAHGNSGDESLYQSEESCDSRLDVDVVGNPSRAHLDIDYSGASNNNLKQDACSQGSLIVNNGQ